MFNEERLPCILLIRLKDKAEITSSKSCSSMLYNAYRSYFICQNSETISGLDIPGTRSSQPPRKLRLARCEWNQLRVTRQVAEYV